MLETKDGRKMQWVSLKGDDAVIVMPDGKAAKWVSLLTGKRGK